MKKKHQQVLEWKIQSRNNIQKNWKNKFKKKAIKLKKYRPSKQTTRNCKKILIKVKLYDNNKKN